MADHAELVKEMVELEKLSSQERLKLARKRRQQQLKKFAEYEKKSDKQERQAQKRKAKATSMIQQPGGMLLLPGKSKTISYPPSTKAGHALDELDQQKRNVYFDKGVMLLEAAARNDVTEVKALLEARVNPDVANEDGLTALHQCCIDDSEVMLLLLLDYGANVNSRDSELWTPLHAAATCAHLRICQHLLGKSADLLAVNADGNMPYDICDDETTLEYIETEMASQGVTQDLIDATRHSAEKNMLDDITQYEQDGNCIILWKDRHGASLLHIAAANGHYDVVTYLLTKRVDVNLTDSDNWTPAMAAACWGQIPVLELLAKNGADLDVKTKDNKSLVDLVDDLEVKDQITEIKQEIKSNLERFRRANSDVRRRSSNNIRSAAGIMGPSSLYNSNTSLTDRNPFSSSVRRHSMREKHKLSLKEAREEGRYRISINITDQSPTGDSSGTVSPTEVSPLPSEASTVPVTNIDDINMTVTDNNVTTIDIIEPADSSTSPRHSIADGDSVVEATPKLVATIQLAGDEADPQPTKLPTPSQPHMNGDRNSNQATIKVDSLNHKHESDEDTDGGPDPAIAPPNEEVNTPVDHNSQGKPATGGVAANPPVLQHFDPPMRRYTAYGQPAIGAKEKKPAKGCCVIS